MKGLPILLALSMMLAFAAPASVLAAALAPKNEISRAE